ncbi:porin [Vibrio sp. RC27]
MKKTLIAVALLSTIGSVNAAEIYASDGLALEISGEADVKYIKGQAEDSDAELNLESSTISADFSYEASEALVAGAYYEIDGTGDTGFEVSDLYVYLVANDSSTLSIGDQSTVFDDAGIGSDYDFGFSSNIANGSIATGGDQVVKYSYDGGETMYASVAYILQKGGVDDDYQVDGKIGLRSGDADFTLFGAQAETGDLSSNAYILEASYTRGDIELAATYGISTTEQAVGDDIDGTIFGLAAVYDPGEFLAYSAGWALVDRDDLDDAINDVYVNATYYFTDNVSTYAEVGFTDQDDAETGYVVGMNVSF